MEKPLRLEAMTGLCQGQLTGLAARAAAAVGDVAIQQACGVPVVQGLDLTGERGQGQQVRWRRHPGWPPASKVAVRQIRHRP